jgi:nucleotide-binding universal stress UspA family protein
MNERDESMNAATRPGPFGHLFVATDFSAGAAQAISRAARLPIAERGKVTIVHVLSNDVPTRMRADAEKAARRNLQQAAKTFTRIAATVGGRNIQVTPGLCPGKPYVELVRQARLVGADLIVMGRHGKRPIRDMFIGSTAERVVRAGDLPVLVVNRRASNPYRRPFVAVDLDDASRQVVTVALRAIAPDVPAATMVHVYHVPFEGFMTPSVASGEMTSLRKEFRDMAASGLRTLQEGIGEVGVRWQAAIVRGDARLAILSAAARGRADLLTVGTHGRSGIAHAILGSVAEWVIRGATCDVLVARAAPKRPRITR